MEVGTKETEVFKFKIREDRIDWNGLHYINLEDSIKRGDIDSLAPIIDNLAYSKIQTTDLEKIADSNILKVFKLSQLAIDYLFDQQNKLYQSAESYTEEANFHNQENEYLKVCSRQNEQKIKELNKKIKSLKKKADTKHKKGVKCEECLKLFVSEDYLDKHMKRRHPELHPPLNIEQETAQSYTHKNKEEDSFSHSQKEIALLKETFQKEILEVQKKQKQLEEELHNSQVSDKIHLKSIEDEHIESVLQKQMNIILQQEKEIDLIRKQNQELIFEKKDLENKIEEMSQNSDGPFIFKNKPNFNPEESVYSKIEDSELNSAFASLNQSPNNKQIEKQKFYKEHSYQIQEYSTFSKPNTPLALAYVVKTKYFAPTEKQIVDICQEYKQEKTESYKYTHKSSSIIDEDIYIKYMESYEFDEGESPNKYTVRDELEESYSLNFCEESDIPEKEEAEKVPCKLETSNESNIEPIEEIDRKSDEILEDEMNRQQEMKELLEEDRDLYEEYLKIYRENIEKNIEEKEESYEEEESKIQSISQKETENLDYQDSNIRTDPYDYNSDSYEPKIMNKYSSSKNSDVSRHSDDAQYNDTDLNLEESEHLSIISKELSREYQSSNHENLDKSRQSVSVEQLKLEEAAEIIGIDPIKYKRYVYLAELFIEDPIPYSWELTSKGYYKNIFTGETSEENPGPKHYYRMFRDIKRKHESLKKKVRRLLGLPSKEIKENVLAHFDVSGNFTDRRSYFEEEVDNKLSGDSQLLESFIKLQMKNDLELFVASQKIDKELKEIGFESIDIDKFEFIDLRNEKLFIEESFDYDLEFKEGDILINRDFEANSIEVSSLKESRDFDRKNKSSVHQFDVNDD